MPNVAVHDKGEDYEISVKSRGDGFVEVVVLVDGEHTSRLPLMTPFEAGMLAKQLELAAEADWYVANSRYVATVVWAAFVMGMITGASLALWFSR